MNNFNRYANFKANGKVSIVPFINITKKNSDKYILYKKSVMRLDKISYEHYGNPDYAWLIMQANPEYGSIENFIPDGVVLRIPYPLEDTINKYLNDINTYNQINK
jgi:hypothetical protein